MKQLLQKYFRGGVALALLGAMICGLPSVLQAKSKRGVSVDVKVTVHGSDINVSNDVLEKAVEDLLETAAIKVVDEGADSGAVELEIDIYKEEDGFKISTDWDDDDEAEAEKHADTQDEIDNIVEDTVAEFIEFIQEA